MDLPLASCEAHHLQRPAVQLGYHTHLHIGTCTGLRACHCGSRCTKQTRCYLGRISTMSHDGCLRLGTLLRSSTEVNSDFLTQDGKHCDTDSSGLSVRLVNTVEGLGMCIWSQRLRRIACFGNAHLSRVHHILSYTENRSQGDYPFLFHEG